MTTNTAEQIEPAEKCAGCDHERDIIDGYRVETIDGEIVARWCRDCAATAKADLDGYGFLAVRDMTDTETTDADRKACQGLYPERDLFVLDGRELNVLFARDYDVWSVASAHDLDGNPVLTTETDRKIRRLLDERAERLRNDW